MMGGIGGRRGCLRAAVAIAALAAPLLTGCAPILSLFERRSALERFVEHERRKQRIADEAAREQRRNASAEDKIKAADQLRDTGRIERAAWAYLEAYRKDPENPVPQERMGFLQVTRDPARAESIFSLLVEEQPARSTVHAGLGLARLAQGRPETARPALERAVELDPEDTLSLNTLAVVYDVLGEHEAAQRYFRRVEALRPRDANVANNLGVSYILLGDFLAAEAALRRAVSLSPDDPAAWNNLGLALGHQARYADALESFRKAGDEQAALNNLGYVYYLNGLYEEAIAHYEAALLHDGNQKLTVLRNLEAAQAAAEDAAKR